MTGGGGASARDVILARIGEALRQPAPPPHGLMSHDLAAHDLAAHDLAADSPEPAATSAATTTTTSLLSILPEEAARPWLPDGGETAAERLRILEENLGRLRAVMRRVPDLTAAGEYFFALCRERDWQRVAWHAHPLVEPLVHQTPCATFRVDAAGFDKNTLESCDVGITACDAVVAQTGSILVSSGSCGGRSLSILPHVHVVVATLDQIVATLADALHALRDRHAGRLPSMLSFITGPSRTGDIERILVLGAHGPKELFVILVG
jgi:L-lactate dehydrogenase complex protein LldG